MILFTKNVLVTYIIEMCLKMTYNNIGLKKGGTELWVSLIGLMVYLRV